MSSTLRSKHLEFQYFVRHLQYLLQNSDGSFSKIDRTPPGTFVLDFFFGPLSLPASALTTSSDILLVRFVFENNCFLSPDSLHLRMSAEAQATQVEAQTAQVEEEYRHEDKHDHKDMDAKLLDPKFNANLLTKAYGDNLSTRSVKSDGDDHHLPSVRSSSSMLKPGSHHLSENQRSPVSTLRWTKIGVSG